MTKLTTTRLAELKRLEQAATRGPWRNGIGGVSQISDGGKGYPLDCYPDCADVVTTDGTNEGRIATEADLEFIAASRTALPELIERVEELATLAEQALCIAENFAPHAIVDAPTNSGTLARKEIARLRKLVSGEEK